MTDPLKYTRRLTIALMISGGANILLVALFSYWMIRERPPTPYFELKPANILEQQAPLAIDHSNSEVIRYFRKMPLEWLVARLNNTKLVENGYTQRDLALASLVAFHNFDIDRALAVAGLASPEQKRTIVYGKYRDGRPAELVIYPGLSEKYCEAILAFASRERFPVTSKGLFLMLKKQQKESRDSATTDTFFLSPEFLGVETLFNRGEVPVEKNEILEVILQGDWTILSTFMEQQKSSQDLSAARRQHFLLDYIKKKSKAAAYLMLKTDGDFVARKLDDNHVILILQLLDEKSKESEQLALALLSSPRSDVVWKIAATRLYEYSGESMPENYRHQAALSRFVPEHSVLEAAGTKAPVISSAPPIIPPPVTKKAAPPAKANTTVVKNVASSTKSSSKKDKVATSTKDKAVTSTSTSATNKSDKAKKTASNSTKTAKAKSSTKNVAVSEKSSQDKTYVVQDGDSLWKIARKFNVSVDVLRAYNKLDSDALRPGKSLKIPSK